ncbi:hypothetical protein Ancab_006378 [Ancistrocladus abbreviatus]
MMEKTVKILDDFTSQQLSRLHEEREKGCGEHYCLGMSYISKSKADEKVHKDEALALILPRKGTAVSCEILRLFPPIPNLAKGSYKPRVLSIGHHVGPNTLILLSLLVMGRLTLVRGKDSLEFKPEKWIMEKGELKHELTHKFLTFNIEPRICYGKDVAFMETKAIAATIVHNYNVQIARGQDTRPTNAIIVKMKDGLRATIRKRWS